MGRPAADLLQSLHEGRGAKRLSRNEGIDYPFYSFGVSFARHADMPGWLREAGRVTYRTFLAKGNVADFGKPCMVDDVQGDLLPKLHEAEGAQRLQRGR